ncbi:protein kinase activating protein DPB11 NDAI_0G05520 [Naumovozyma dairenensis CBS 421]|uniref:BRCT domain-containing protein n=1 Tax=Naumovozyma dairenensis (strain ATCC 10597 / BCRC 20456 / CBS 421 / NBRC 0211 / NRRL Y-12639) TaxID=1071378 RepID=J7SBS9_NAUDC|nr:hypothetical protein NDAI_0G05520 [Naumovozyma dairenensis CBS 421]CCK73535.1 hypothetical protein NDAI_0G05520 [Naumovozyma dairenensis CBS 421]
MKPLSGIVFCPTALPETTLKSITKKIIKLGGTYSKDLTRNTNVLLVNKRTDSSKYKFIVKNRPDVIFMDYNHLFKLYDLWVSGEDITMQNHSNYKHLQANLMDRMLHVIKDKYSSKAFRNFFLFIGRINDQNHSVKEIEKLCYEQDCFGCDSKIFARDAVSKNPNREFVFITDSIYGARVEAARDENIPIVHHKWVIDCHIRGAKLEFDPDYLLENVVDKTTDQIGYDLTDVNTRFNNQPLMTSSTYNNLSSQQQQQQQPPHNIGKSFMLEKFKPQGTKLWEKVTSNDKMKQRETHEEEKYSSPSLNQNYQHISNFPPETPYSNEIFTNCTFHLDASFPEAHYNILRKVIVQNHGEIMITSQSTIVPDYYIVPSNIPLEEIKLPFSHKDPSPTLVTEFFLERCLHYKKLLSPIDSWSKPFFYTRNIKLQPTPKLLHSDNTDDGSDSLVVAMSGFHGVELLHLTKILKILEPMGIKFSKYLNESTDLLILNLSPLSSIPQSHTLWQNEYSDLFKENYISKSKENKSPVFRNSMKKKIEFVTKNHHIPTVTPAFLIYLFQQSQNITNRKGLNTNADPDPDPGPDPAIIYLNNINWCIFCPRAEKNQFICKLISINSHKQEQQKRNYNPTKSPINQIDLPSDFISRPSSKNVKVDTTPLLSHSRKNSTSTTTNLKMNPNEIIDKMNQNHLNNNLKNQKKRIIPIKREIISPEQKKRVLTPRSSPIKRPKLHDVTITNKLKIERSSSWGHMISDELEIEQEQEQEQHEEQEDIHFNRHTRDNLPNYENREHEMGSTQVTYGSPTLSGNSRTGTMKGATTTATTRRITRKRVKELGS